MPGDLQQLILNSDLIYDLTRNLPNPERILDVADNDSDKTLTVPANRIWEVLSIRVKYVSTATGGTRQLTVQVRDDSDVVILGFPVGATQIESLTRYYNFGQLFPHETSFIGNELLTPLHSNFLIPAGFDLRIYDSGAIDPAADDMHIWMMINRFDV